jgi:hypothetical protein
MCLFEVRSEFLNIIQMSFGFKRLKYARTENITPSTMFPNMLLKFNNFFLTVLYNKTNRVDIQEFGTTFM